MDHDAARHAISMDQVLLSGHKPQAEKTVARDAAKTLLPKSIQAQQHRIATSLSRRNKLPPLPPALQDVDGQRTEAQPSSSMMEADVPVVVEINAAAAPISQSTVHSAQTAQTAQPVKPVQPAFRWSRHSDQLVEQIVRDLMQDRSQFPKSLTDALDEAEWDTLKSGLRQVVEDWVDRQRKNRA